MLTEAFIQAFNKVVGQRSLRKKSGLIPTGKREGLFLKGKDSPGTTSRVSDEVIQ